MGKVREEGLAQLYSINRFKKVKQMIFEGMNLYTVELEGVLIDIPASPLQNVIFEGEQLHGVSPELLASTVQSLTAVNLSMTNLKKDHSNKLLEASLTSTTLEDLNLACVNLSGVRPDLLASAVKRLKTINLGFTYLPNDQMIKLLEASLTSTTLDDLNLAGVNMSGVPSDLLASAVKCLKKINLGYTTLTTNQSNKLLEASLSSSTLDDLNLSDVNLSGVTPDLLASAVKRLKTVALTDTKLTVEQSNKLLDASLTSTTLEDLNLTGVDLSGVTPTLLASAVKRLKTVKLNHTELTVEQCNKLLDASLTSTRLDDLNLYGVDLSGVTPDLLASAVKRLKTVDLGYTEVTVDQGVAVLNCIPTSTTLRRVNLSFNHRREDFPADVQYLITSMPAYVNVQYNV